MTYDPGMDQSPDVWTSPEIDPGFPQVPHSPTPPENTDDPVGEVTHFPNAEVMHRETLDAIRATNSGLSRLIEQGMQAGFQIIRLDAGAAPIPQSQHIRFRVQAVIVNPVTAGQLSLTTGTVSYPFDGAARILQVVPFPLVIERGTDLSCVGADGRIYLIGIPE